MLSFEGNSAAYLQYVYARAQKVVPLSGITNYPATSALATIEPADRNLCRILLKFPEVLECHHIAGEEDYLLKVIIRDIEEYEQFLREKLTRFSGISRIKTYFILNTLKQDTKIPVE